MDLLPKHHEDFATKEYWNSFFSRQKSQLFEWYGNYETLNAALHKYMKLRDRILIVGCGSSQLSADLYDVGFCNTLSVDISSPVIKQMRKKYGKSRPNLQFEVMDVLNMTYEDGDFSVVLDKGTLDALLINEEPETLEKIDRMFSEIDRVLRYGGRYLCFSLLQEHVLKKILHWFIDKGWFIRLHRCMRAETVREGSMSFRFPVFCVIATKMKIIEGAPMLLEVIPDEESSPQRYSSMLDIIDYVKSAQHFAFVKHYLQQNTQSNEDIFLEFCCSDTGTVKYKVYVTDRKGPSKLKFAIFVVPQGREVEWLYSTCEGRRHLAESANCQRLIVVHLQRDVFYGSLQEVGKEVSVKFFELVGTYNSQIPILSLGSDVGHREIRMRDTSKISGDFVVEDFDANDNSFYRRLIFLSNPYLIQSEAKLMGDPTVEEESIKIDFDYLACSHHAAMISGLSFLKENMFCPKVLIVGLGGGNLAMYLYKHFPQSVIEAVELDPCIVEVAKKWFSLATDDRLKVEVADGLAFMKEAVAKGIKYDAVILDVDNKDSTIGMSSPPVEFLEQEVLQNIANLVTNTGVIMMNLASRNTELHSEAYSKLKVVFRIFSKKIPEEVNEVVYCLPRSTQENILHSLQERYTELVSFLESDTSSAEVFDLVSFVSSLKEIE